MLMRDRRFLEKGDRAREQFRWGLFYGRTPHHRSGPNHVSFSRTIRRGVALPDFSGGPGKGSNPHLRSENEIFRVTNPKRRSVFLLLEVSSS